jgi:preprotein translocase subunit Sec63
LSVLTCINRSHKTPRDIFSKAIVNPIGDMIRPFYFSSAVLNVPRDAPQAEINERHRALSLIFHPDKLHGEPPEVKEVATEEFLEIQKAYQG